MAKNNTNSLRYMPQNSAVWFIINHMPTIGKKGEYDMTMTQFKFEIGDNKITVSNETNAEILLEDILKKTNPTVTQTFIYLLCKYYENKKKTFSFTPDDCFDFKAVTNKQNNEIRLIEDLKVLSCTHINMVIRIKEKMSSVYGNLLTYCVIDKPIKKIEVTLGPIVDILLESPYAVFRPEMVQYNAQKEIYESIISPKLNERYRVNLKNRTTNKQEWEKLSVQTLLDIIGVTDEMVSKRGIRYYFEKLNEALKNIGDKEGFEFKFEVESYISRNEFYNDNVMFKNKLLDKYYGKLYRNYGKSRNKNIKTVK